MFNLAKYNLTKLNSQQNGMNILKNLSSDDYKTVLANIKHYILATDMAKYFGNVRKLDHIFKSGSFDWKNKDHK